MDSGSGGMTGGVFRLGRGANVTLYVIEVGIAVIH